MAYKIIENLEEGNFDIFKNNVYIPMDNLNSDYIQFLDDMSQEIDTLEGPDIVEPSYTELRQKSYPSMEEQLDMQYWDSVNGTTTWADAIQAIKDTYPTSITGGVTVGDVPSLVTDAITDYTAQKQKSQYARAIKRLENYVLADGREEVTEERVVDTLYLLNEDGHPLIGEDGDQVTEDVTETIIVQTAIDPLPATIMITTSDPETREVTTEEIVNPLIAEDNADRALAQSVVDATPEEIITAYNEENS
jgi:hypothetical protein